MSLEINLLFSIFPRKSLWESCMLLQSQSGLSYHQNTPSGTGCELYCHLHLARYFRHVDAQCHFRLLERNQLQCLRSHWSCCNQKYFLLCSCVKGCCNQKYLLRSCFKGTNGRGAEKEHCVFVCVPVLTTQLSKVMLSRYNHTGAYLLLTSALDGGECGQCPSPPEPLLSWLPVQFILCSMNCKKSWKLIILDCHVSHLMNCSVWKDSVYKMDITVQSCVLAFGG
jgi:hypothetical protein